jgi:hypothetical protein
MPPLAMAMRCLSAIAGRAFIQIPSPVANGIASGMICL